MHYHTSNTLITEQVYHISSICVDFRWPHICFINLKRLWFQYCLYGCPCCHQRSTCAVKSFLRNLTGDWSVTVGIFPSCSQSGFHLLEPLVVCYKMTLISGWIFFVQAVPQHFSCLRGIQAEHNSLYYIQSSTTPRVWLHQLILTVTCIPFIYSIINTSGKPTHCLIRSFGSWLYWLSPIKVSCLLYHNIEGKLNFLKFKFKLGDVIPSIASHNFNWDYSSSSKVHK